MSPEYHEIRHPERKQYDMKVTLYTDGAARGNPDGPGGYGAVL